MSVIDYDVLKGATTSKTWEMDVKDMSHRTLETTSQTMLFRLIVADKQGINYLLCIWLIVAINCCKPVFGENLRPTDVVILSVWSCQELPINHH